MSRKGLKIVSVNIRSLYPSIDEVRCKFKNFDVIGICETWLNNTYDDNLVLLDNYMLFRADRESGNILNQQSKSKRGGGLAIYVGSKFRGHVNQFDECTKITKNLEQMWLFLDKPNVRKMAICMLYRPPNGEVQLAFDELSVSIDYIQARFDVELVIMGDVNINYRDRHNNAFDVMKEFERVYNLDQLIHDPTRITNRSKTTIDLIWTNMEHICDSGVLDTILSDHMPVYVVKKKSREEKEFKYITGRSYKYYIKEDFQDNIIMHEDWASFWDHSENDPEKSWEIMKNIIMECAEFHCPIKSMKIRDNSPTWFNRELIEELYYKDDLYNLARHSGKEIDWENFRSQNRRVKRLILEAKEEYVKDLLEQNKGNPRKFWRNINNISGLGKRKCNRGIEKIYNETGEELQNSDAAEYMNNYYTEAGPKLAQKIDMTWEASENLKKHTCKFEFDFISEALVKKLVSEIKISKSSAVNNLSSRILKDAFQVLIFELTHLYNLCIGAGIFPRDWSIGKISPIPKTNKNSYNPKDWRPITQIPLPGKLFERIIHDQIYKYFDDNKLFFNGQYGFRKGKSTAMAIFDVLKELYDNWNERMYSGCIYVDFSKAFETIDHEILLKKFQLYGFDNSSQKFLKHYVTTRTQTTTVGEHVSDMKYVRCGTAQGSILGPLIYIIYVNDVLGLLGRENNLYLYADDMLVMARHKNVEVMLNDLQTRMDKICIWCKQNKLTINEVKTKYMIVSNVKIEPITKISIAGKNLGKVSQYEYLGMTIQEKLSMDVQIESMYKKANKKLGIMSRIRRFITKGTAVKIYKTMIRPHLEYVDFIVESGSKIMISKFTRLQERALRRIHYCNVPENEKSYTELEKQFDIENLYVRRNRNLLNHMYGQSKIDINIASETCDRILRSTKKVKMKYKFSNLTKLHNSPYYRGVKLWNTLPENIQNCTTKSEFKNLVRKWQK